MRRPAVLLDIDGTLLDTNHLHVVAWWRGFRRLGLTFPMARIHPLIGMGGDLLVPALADHDVDGAEDAYAEEFAALRSDLVPLPGARDLVRALAGAGAGAGVAVVLASSAAEEDVVRFRRALDVDEWLLGTTSSGDVERSKPAPELFEVAMARYDLERDTTLAIGDATWDGEAARRRGIGFVAVETGGTASDDLRRAGALEVYTDAAALLADLPDGPLGRLLDR